MSDGLIATATHEPVAAPPDHAVRRFWVGAALQGLAVVAVFAGAGALCGLLWFRLWDVPHGVVSGHQWFTSETGLRADFSGTGWYVVIAVLAGLVLGALAAWLLRPLRAGHPGRGGRRLGAGRLPDAAGRLPPEPAGPARAGP